MKRIRMIIGVDDVPRSVEWYQALFGQPATPPGHDYFGQILDEDWDSLALSSQSGVPTTVKFAEIRERRAPSPAHHAVFPFQNARDLLVREKLLWQNVLRNVA